MNEEKIFELIKQITLDILPELAGHTICLNDSLRDIGANSVDRAEILNQTRAALNLKTSLTEFGHAKNLADLVTIFMEKFKDQRKQI